MLFLKGTFECNGVSSQARAVSLALVWGHFTDSIICTFLVLLRFFCTLLPRLVYVLDGSIHSHNLSHQTG